MDINVMLRGLHPHVARHLGGTVTSSVTAAGSAQSDATRVDGGLVLVSTVNSSTGIRLPPASESCPTMVVNAGANALSVYPASGEYINAGSQNAAFSVTNAKAAIFIPFGNRWGAGLFA